MGQYAEGDVFIGITVPELRKIAKKYVTSKSMGLREIKMLLCSKIHEERMVALLILIEKFKRAHSEVKKGKIVKFYLDNLRGVNNWDLVDLSAPNILGSFLTEKNGMGRKRSLQLLRLARSKSVWMRR